MRPETFYATVGQDRVAYQTVGSGEHDIVFTLGLWTHLDGPWEDPSWARFFRKLASYGRLICFDRRGSGLSDPRPQDGQDVVTHWGEDLLAVLAATGSARMTLIGSVDAGLLALPFIVQNPECCERLVLINSTARLLADKDYPVGLPLKSAEKFTEQVRSGWGTERWAAALIPSRADDENFCRWFARWCRSTANPRGVVENLQAVMQLDARDCLPQVRIPALLLARPKYPLTPSGHSEYMAARLPDARFVEIAGTDALPFWEGADEILDHIEHFITGSRRGQEPQRSLHTVLFTDIVGSTRQAARLGDTVWRERLDQHDRIIQQQVALYRGRFVESAGDGTLTVFDNPRAALECAHALHAALTPLKLKIRAGLHFGEVELREDGRVGGLAIHIGARVLALAKPGEVLVSRTLRDILIGSPYEFKERGIHVLDGVPSKWPLYAARRPRKGLFS